MSNGHSAALRAELLALRGPDGLINARGAVAWAESHPESALYAALEWSDEKAAIEYRISQVRALISFHVVDAEGNRQLVSLSVDRAAGGGYRAVDDVVQRPDLRAIMLADALDELERVRKRYEHITELVALWEGIDAARTEAAERADRAAKARRPARPKRKRKVA